MIDAIVDVTPILSELCGIILQFLLSFYGITFVHYNIVMVITRFSNFGPLLMLMSIKFALLHTINNHTMALLRNCYPELYVLLAANDTLSQDKKEKNM